MQVSFRTIQLTDGKKRVNGALRARAAVRPALRQGSAFLLGLAGGWAVLYGALMPFGLGLTLGFGEDCFAVGAAGAALGLLARGALALGLSTDFFPWRILCSIRKPFSTFFMQIQFPWSFVGMAVPMLSAAAAWGYLREEKDAKTGMAALIALCVVFSGYTMQTIL